MKTPPPLRFTCSIRDLTVTDTKTGDRIQCTSVEHMAQVRRDLELKAMPVKAQRQTKTDRRNERRQAGMKV